MLSKERGYPNGSRARRSRWAKRQGLFRPSRPEAYSSLKEAKEQSDTADCLREKAYSRVALHDLPCKLKATLEGYAQQRLGCSLRPTIYESGLPRDTLRTLVREC